MFHKDTGGKNTTNPKIPARLRHKSQDIPEVAFWHKSNKLLAPINFDIMFLIFAGVAMVVGLYVLAIGRNWKGCKDIFLDEYGIYTLSGKKKELDIGWDEIVEAEITMPRTRQGIFIFLEKSFRKKRKRVFEDRP